MSGVVSGLSVLLFRFGLPSLYFRICSDRCGFGAIFRRSGLAASNLYFFLSKHGFILNRPFRSAELRWNEICGFTQMSYKGVLTFQIRSSIVALYLSKPNNFPEKQPLPKKLCFLAEDKLFGSCIRFYFLFTDFFHSISIMNFSAVCKHIFTFKAFFMSKFFSPFSN